MPERYRFRGAVKPSAEVKRPVAVHLAAAETGSSGSGGAKTPTSATIDIFDVIDSWGGYWGISAGEVDQALTKVGKVDTLYVRINSPGGEATEGIAIANLLRAHAAKIHTTNYGLAASAASIIAVAGDTVAMAPGSMMMVHCASNVLYGNAEDLRSEAGTLDKFDESIASLYVLKAGGSLDDWLGRMRAETWMTPDDAVTAKLADKVGIEAGPLPANVDPAVPAETGDGEATPFDRAAAMFDLSVFAHAPAAKATPKPPAEPPEKHPSTEEAVTMTETELKALRERLSLAEDADAAAINAKLDELEEQATHPGDGKPPAITDDAVAEAHGLTAEQVRDALAAAKTGKVTVSATMLEELKANAAAGAAARAKQLEEERDTTVDEAIRQGKVSRDRRDAWRDAWDKDPDGTKADLTSLEVRFPVGKPTGHAGSDGSDGAGNGELSADEAQAIDALAGVGKVN